VVLDLAVDVECLCMSVLDLAVDVECLPTFSVTRCTLTLQAVRVILMSVPVFLPSHVSINDQLFLCFRVFGSF